MEIIDTHCHLDVEAFDADRGAVIDAARATGVTAIVVPAIHRVAWPRLLALCRAGTGLHPALGLHPVYLAQHRDTDLHELEACIQTQPPLAIGEIGLDFVVPDLDRDRQQRL
ncbi:MAG: TatD family hydrolase, partial [Gammaproteobacteria bacterium]|nr:TatD family hydrolase [Gammaproteobacteria bacterium]